MAGGSEPKSGEGGATKAGASRAHTSLTPRQQRFVEEYLIDANATQAAIRAGYSAKTANEQGARLLANVSVAEAIAAAQAARSTRTEITADRVLQELARIGFSDLRGAFTETGALKSLVTLTDDTAAAISSVKVVTRREPGGGEDAEVEYVTEIKLWDKNSALDKLAKHLGITPERHEVTGKNGAPIQQETVIRPAISREEWLEIHGLGGKA